MYVDREEDYMDCAMLDRFPVFESTDYYICEDAFQLDYAWRVSLDKGWPVVSELFLCIYYSLLVISHR